MYAPIQTGLLSSASSRVSYIEVQPKKEHQEVSCCFWQLENSTILYEDFIYTVLPDGCVDMVFELKSSPAVRGALLMTPGTSTVEVNLGKAFSYVGIRFMPGSWTMDLPEIVGQNKQYGAIGRLSLARYQQRMSGLDNSEIRKILTELLSKLIDNNVVSLNQDIRQLLKRQTEINTVEEMAGVLSLSTRQLRRRVKAATGFTPKDFLKILRFQSALKAHELSAFHDQSHYIKEFRMVTGLTPKQYRSLFS